MKRAAIILLAGMLSMAASAQTTTYSEDFTAGTSNDPGSPQVDNWENFRDGLTATYTNITVGGSQGPDVSCSEPAALAAIATALNTDATASIPCEGRTWNVGTCIGTNELSIDVGICTCQGASPFTLRPDVDAGNAAWGGIGATCGPGASGAGANVNQTLTVSVTELVVPTEPDLSLSLVPASLSPSVGANTFLDIVLANNGANAATGVTVEAVLPSGLTFVSDDSGGSYNQTTGVWNVGSVTPGSSPRLRIVVGVEAVGDYTIAAEVATANEVDADSTPGNAATLPGEDDSDSVTLTPVTPPPPLFCLGRPIQPLIFTSPVAESAGANLALPQVGDVFRFPNVSPGVDALVEVTAFNNGATLAGIDNDGTTTAPIGVPDNFQPTLVGPAGDVSVDFEITVVGTGTTIPGTLDFAGSAIDVDGDSGGLREYIEVSNNVVEFALNGVIFDDPADPADVPDDTRLITQANLPPDPGASAPSPGRIRFEAETDDTAASINPDEPRNIAAAFFTDVSVFQYRIGKFGDATTGRLNSLAFNCPAIDPGGSGGGAFTEEDFGDAPFDVATAPGYGNPIHVIDASDPLVQLGATNTAETASGNDTVLDAGDDGITIGTGTAFEGVTLQGLAESATITATITNGTADNGLLQAFFDWNADGDFDDDGEQPIVDLSAAPSDGTLTFTVTPPVGTVAGPSFARFRWATTSVGVQDATANGEVEDYRINLLAADPSDLSLTINASNSSPGIGQTITLTVVVTNDGPAEASGIVASIPLPAGLTFVSSDGGPAFDQTTGEWTLPAPLASGESVTLSIEVTAGSLGTSTVLGEIIASDRPDTDSTPGNAGATPGEDDTDSVDIFVLASPPTCPAGFTLSNTGGTAVAVTFEDTIGNSGQALGALSPEGTAPPDAVAAFVNVGAESILVIDLGVIVPENAQMLFSLARDGGGAGDDTMLEIRTSLDETNFPTQLDVYGPASAGATLVSTAQDTLERFFVTSPPGGARFVRFDILNGDNGFVDGISFTQSCLPGGELSGSKTVTVFDPLGEGLFALPGNDVTYTINVQNTGASSTDEDSIFLIDELPPEVVFFNGDADGPGPGVDPVNFEDVVTTGLDPFVFADSVRFAGAGPAPVSFADCTLVTVAGYDPNIRYVCFNPQGVMNSGDPNPEFSLSFRVRIR